MYTKELLCEIAKLDTMAADYVAEKTNYPFVVLDKAAEIYVNHTTDLSPELQEVFGRCLSFINHDFEKPMTFEEFVSYGDSLIEEVCGYCGQLLDEI